MRLVSFFAAQRKRKAQVRGISTTYCVASCGSMRLKSAPENGDILSPPKCGIVRLHHHRQDRSGCPRAKLGIAFAFAHGAGLSLCRPPRFVSHSTFVSPLHCLAALVTVYSIHRLCSVTGPNPGLMFSGTLFPFRQKLPSSIASSTMPPQVIVFIARSCIVELPLQPASFLLQMKG